MKTHRPWQPHMSSSPLFNPFSPLGKPTPLDHLDLMVDERLDETEGPAESLPPEEAGEPPLTKRE